MQDTNYNKQRFSLRISYTYVPLLLYRVFWLAGFSSDVSAQNSVTKGQLQLVNSTIPSNSTRANFLKEHEGHENQHLSMMYVFIFTIILTQIILFLWNRFFPAAYQIVTLLGMWFIPFGVSCYHGFYRMLFVWTMYTSMTLTVLFKATRPLIRPSVPRLVYTYFFSIYKICYGLGVLGYVMLMIDIMGVTRIVTDFFGVPPNQHPVMQWGMLGLFYGLYYG